MACFTDLDYRNKSYPLLLAIAAKAVEANVDYNGPVSYGCFDSMSDAAKLYQFYSALQAIAQQGSVTENCFVQKTPDQQLFLFNSSIENVLNLIPIGG
jgi:hypothetical protein